MINVLELQFKTIRALRDISEGRLRLKGPRYELCNPGEGWTIHTIPLEPGWKKNQAFVKQHLQADSYTQLRARGEIAEGVPQETAERLCLKEPVAAELVSGYPFNAWFDDDETPRFESWYKYPQYGPPNEAFEKFELIEILVDDFRLMGYPVDRGQRVRVNAEFFGQSPLRYFRWLDDPRLNDPNGNPFPYRILKVNPEPAQQIARDTKRALMAEGSSKIIAQQGSLIKQMWQKLFPGDQPPAHPA